MKKWPLDTLFFSPPTTHHINTKMPPSTLDFYNDHAAEYVEDTYHISMQHIYDQFLPLIPDGGHILDAGCGSCRDSAFFHSQKFQVTAFDASEALVTIAQGKHPFPIFCATFETFSTEILFDGIWASASLLHLSESEIDQVIPKLKGLLKENGILYCSFKIAKEPYTDDKGRFFIAMTPTKLKHILEPHFTKITVFSCQGIATEVWCNAIAKC